jgi:glucose/mannose transport system substrate-binding protein
MLRKFLVGLVLISVLGAFFAVPVLAEALSGKVEVNSWWTAGGEAEGLNAMIKIYESKYPNIEFINATVAGGAGTNAKAVFKTRMLGGDPPDTFQVHAGHELIDTWVVPGYMQPLTDLYKSEGWTESMPQGVLDIVSYQGDYWSVPVNIHRSNVLWFNKSIFDKYKITPPSTFGQFFDVCEELKSKGVAPFVMGTTGGWEAGHVFESVLLGKLGADSRVTDALETFAKMSSYLNTDHSALTWDEAGQYLLKEKGAMMIMGDWTNGWFMSVGFEDYGWAPPPNNDGIFLALSDSFALPKGCKNQENVIAWLKVLGSKEGQYSFNKAKGSIPARTDIDTSDYNDYLKSAARDWEKDAISPSVMHGAAASEGWTTEFKDIISLFVSKPDVSYAQNALVTAAEDYLEK